MRRRPTRRGCRCRRMCSSDSAGQCAQRSVCSLSNRYLELAVHRGQYTHEVRTGRTVLSALGVLLLLAAAGIPWRSNQLTNNQTSSDRGAGSRSLRLCSLQRAMVSAAVAVPLRTVRAIGVNATGRTVEPEATTRSPPATGSPPAQQLPSFSSPCSTPSAPVGVDAPSRLRLRSGLMLPHAFGSGRPGCSPPRASP